MSTAQPTEPAPYPVSSDKQGDRGSGPGDRARAGLQQVRTGHARKVSGLSELLGDRALRWRPVVFLGCGWRSLLRVISLRQLGRRGRRTGIAW